MYYLLYSIFYVISLLPMRVLHGVADMAYVLLYHVFGYRKQVVMRNINLSFPEKSEQERKQIAARFYRSFAHIWVELIKCLTIKKEAAARMMEMDTSLLQKLYEQGRSVQLIGGHLFNWELLNMTLPVNQPFPFLAVYMPMGGKAMDRLIYKIRSRFGTVLISATQVKEQMKPWLGKQYMIILGADQRPASPESGHWLNYLNQPAAVVKGPARNARAGNMAVVFGYLQKLGRGRYRFCLEMLVENPESMTEEAITLAFVQRLEQSVRQQPENYLWSHKRWKHPWKPEYAHLWIDTANPPAAS
jgi:KDO2-lipid IV(A) lauroyltransferase